ncbi:MAG: cysteine desulfurase family protein [Hyphomicrobiales bacterium]|nr:cysteine desulfurase family protein [Hyphomicrobiales bacterium]
MTERAYFDWNATAPLRTEARNAMTAALGLPGNASSVHAEGRVARKLIEAARAQVASLVGAEAKNLTFTSGATEANMLALTPTLETVGGKAPRDRLFVSGVEHPSVRSGGRFATDAVEVLPVNSDGIVDLAALKVALARAARPLVSVMLANNETGVIQPIAAIADIVHAANGLLHVDAVQGAGRIDCELAALGADLMSLSSHKLGGPQGAGALVRRDGIHIAEPLIRGGGQERNLRAGTENVAAIAGFGAAAEAAGRARQADALRMAALRDRFEAALKAQTPAAVIFGANAARLPNTSSFAVPGLKAETAIISFDLNGIAVSSGAACSSGKVQISSVLTAMGVEADLARGAIRVSLGWTTTEADIDLLLNAWMRVASTLLKIHENAA